MSTDQQYLTDHGWRLITSQRHQYGKFYYWDHDQHRRTDGMWWTQGDAVALQRRLDRRERGVSRKSKSADSTVSEHSEIRSES